MYRPIMKEAARRHPLHVLPPYDMILECDGFDAVYAFTEAFGGTAVYVPRPRTIFGPCLEMEVTARYNGGNIRELVREFGFSESHIRAVIRRQRGNKA